MKRGKPLSRGKGLERRSELRADAEKVREFLRRGAGWQRPVAPPRAGSRPGGLPRAGGMRRWQEAEGPLSPAEWWERVFDASEGLCIVTGARARDADDPRFEAHHVVPKRVLRARGLYGFVWDPRNGAWLAKRVHERHESAFQRIPRERLPAAVWDFCAELDAVDGTWWATELVRRTYPAAGELRHL